eukprot:scaffold11584_cov160-Amphora_coffeaeformis.AAC.5
MFESGRGANLSWNTMLPIDPGLVQTLGTIEVQRAGPREEASKVRCEEDLNHHVEVNKRILQVAKLKTLCVCIAEETFVADYGTVLTFVPTKTTMGPVL